MNLKELRAKNSLTQTALAKSLGVTSNAISAIEGGRLKLSRKLSDRIKEVYGETIEPDARKPRTPKIKAEKAVEKKAVKKAAKKAEPATTEKKPGRRGRKPQQQTSFVIQSPLGREITTDAILAKIGPVDTVYVRADRNKAYWVKGEETGSVDLW